MRIAGIDPALAVTGYGILEQCGTRLRLVEAGVIRTNARQSHPERLATIHRGIVSLIDEFAPDIMVLEKLYAHWRHPATAYVLGQARGVICLASAEHRLPLVEYGATRVKKAVVGQGHASKVQVQRMVVSQLGLTKTPRYHDTTDALALAMTHFFQVRSQR